MSAWPQYLIAALLLVQFVAHLISDQKEPAKSMDRAMSVLASFIVFGATVAVLWAGGFWTAVGWPS